MTASLIEAERNGYKNAKMTLPAGKEKRKMGNPTNKKLPIELRRNTYREITPEGTLSDEVETTWKKAQRAQEKLESETMAALVTEVIKGLEEDAGQSKIAYVNALSYDKRCGASLDPHDDLLAITVEMEYKSIKPPRAKSKLETQKRYSISGPQSVESHAVLQAESVPEIKMAV